MEAMLAYWLSCKYGPEDGLDSSIFLLAILLAKGERLFPHAFYLGSLFFRLDECVKVGRSIGRYNVVTYATLHCGKPCGHILPKDIHLETIWGNFTKAYSFFMWSKLFEIEVHGEIIEKPYKLYQPRALRWSNVKQNNNKKLSKVIDIEKIFNFWLYSFTPRHLAELQFYADDGGTLTLMSKDDVPMKVLFWLIIISPTLLPSNLKL